MIGTGGGDFYGISEYGKYAADDVPACRNRIFRQKKRDHQRRRTERTGGFLPLYHTAVQYLPFFSDGLGPGYAYGFFASIAFVNRL